LPVEKKEATATSKDMPFDLFFSPCQVRLYSSVM
jgi:hypothetical protein